MFCSKCGEPINDNQSFCPVCGHKVQGGPVPTEEDKVSVGFVILSALIPIAGVILGIMNLTKKKNNLRCSIFNCINCCMDCMSASLHVGVGVTVIWQDKQKQKRRTATRVLLFCFCL